MVNRLPDDTAAQLAKDAFDQAQMSWVQYNFPGTWMPNAGIYYYGQMDLIDPGSSIAEKYLIAWRDKWIAFDLTIPGQSQTEVGVYLDAIKEAAGEIGSETLKIVTFAAVAFGAYYVIKLFRGR